MDEKTQAINFLMKTGWKSWRLAKAAGVPRGTTYRWIHNDGRIYLDQWKKIKTVIGNKS